MEWFPNLSPPTRGSRCSRSTNNCTGDLIECTTAAANPSFLFPVVAGQQIRIQLAQIVVGTHELVLNCFPPGQCNIALDLDLGVNPVSTENSMDSGVVASCFGPAPDSWYVYTASYDTVLDIEMVNGTNADKVFAIYDECGTFDELFCTDDIDPTAMFGVVAGRDYFFKIRDYGTGNSNLILTVDVPDECSAPNLVVNGTNRVSTRLATTSLQSPPCFANGPDTWYRYIGTCSGEVTMSLTNIGGADNVIAVYDECTSLLSITCNSGVEPTVTFPSTLDEDYFVRVRQFTEGDSNLQVSCAPGGSSFIRGDLNEDTIFGLTDVIGLLGVLFSGSSGPGCLDTADINADGTLSLPDVIGLLNFLFSGGSAPSAPHPTCGTAPAGNPTVGCAASNSNCP